MSYHLRTGSIDAEAADHQCVIHKCANENGFLLLAVPFSYGIVSIGGGGEVGTG